MEWMQWQVGPVVLLGPSGWALQARSELGVVEAPLEGHTLWVRTATWADTPVAEALAGLAEAHRRSLPIAGFHDSQAPHDQAWRAEGMTVLSQPYRGRVGVQEWVGYALHVAFDDGRALSLCAHGPDAELEAVGAVVLEVLHHRVVGFVA